jgi:hypothetical protein
MECVLTLMTISAGLLLSIACATLIEELFVGGLFRIFFAPRGPQRAVTQARWGERSGGSANKQAKPGHFVHSGRGR